MSSHNVFWSFYLSPVSLALIAYLSPLSSGSQLSHRWWPKWKKKHPSLRERHWSKIHPYLRKYQEIRPMSTDLYKTYPCLRIMIRISLIYGFSNIYTKIWCCEVEIASWWIIAFYNYRCLSCVTITQIIVFHHWKVNLE